MARFRILSLDGGGIRGAFGAAFLAEFEKRLGRPIVEHFDLIAGTSTGAIIGAALAYGLSAEEVRQFYLNQGPDIFHPQEGHRVKGLLRAPYRLARAFFRGRTQRDLDHFFQARYCPIHLSASFQTAFGDATLGQVRRSRFMVPAVNLTRGRTVVLRTPHLPDPDARIDWRIVDVLQAATAAPTYFPHTTLLDGDAYCDGGLWAANPSILALAEAMRIQQLCDRPNCDPDYDTSAIQVLSIGTGRSTYSLSPPGDDAGILFWSQHVANVMAISQEQGVETPLEYLLGERYYHVNFELVDPGWVLDGVEHIDALMALGKERAAQEFEVVRERFLDDVVAPYTPFDSTSRSQPAVATRSLLPPGGSQGVAL